MRQTSPESVEIFQLLLELYAACDGNWDRLVHETKISDQEVNKFLDYAAAFLSNVGNYYVSDKTGHSCLSADEHRALGIKNSCLTCL